MSGQTRGEQDPTPEMLTLADNLRAMGYDIEPPQPGRTPNASIVARRDLEDRAVIVAVTADGRFRVTMTWVVGEWPSRDQIAGVAVRVIDAVSRAVTITGQVERAEQVVAVVASLDAIAPWASAATPEAPVADDGPAPKR